MQKEQVQIQVKLMREQLQIKKQKMIDELKQLRKEYAVNKETSSSFDATDSLRKIK